MLLILIILVLMLAIVALSFLFRGQRKYSRLEYYFKAREAGFSFSEAGDLKETAQLAGSADPTGILWSPKELERVIKILGAKFKAEGSDQARGNIQFLDRLFQYRKKLEFEQPKYKYGLQSTRQIKQNQRLRLLVNGIGVFNSTVIDNTERFLVCSYPLGTRLPARFSWKGQHVSVYFWRQEDAGYVYDTYIIEDMRIKNVPMLHVAHTEALFRTQKRGSVRISSRISAYLYLLNRLEGAYEKPERVPGMKCLLQDVSEDGFAFLIGGKGKPGTFVKAQFFIGDDQVVMSGTVRGVDYFDDKKQSLIHVEAVKPSPRMCNLIRTYVYNLNGKEEESFDAPFEGADLNPFISGK